MLRAPVATWLRQSIPQFSVIIDTIWENNKNISKQKILIVAIQSALKQMTDLNNDDIVEARE